MRSTLGLAGDLDDVDFLEDVERAFDIRLPVQEIARCSTVGDVFEIVVHQLPSEFAAADRCASTMCFYRVRRAILTFAPELVIKPSTPVKALRTISVKKLYRAFQADAGLAPPPVYLSGRACLALALLATLPWGLLLAGKSWWSAALAIALSIVLYRVSPVRLPPEVSTIGDLVKALTARNVGVLGAQGARLRPKEAWKAFETICESHSVTKGGDIGPGTLILAP